MKWYHYAGIGLGLYFVLGGLAFKSASDKILSEANKDLEGYYYI